MSDADDLEAARRWFAEDVREAAPVVNNEAIIDAFATVRREDYLGPGPWLIHSRLSVGDVHRSRSDNARHLCHDVLVSLVESAGINNGLPSLWARIFDNLNIRPGDSVFQIGTGVGYYTAILAELVGPTGRVVTYEIEDNLAEMAARNLAHYENVRVVCGDATEAGAVRSHSALVACAGVTHIPPRWLEQVGHGGQIVVPFTGTKNWGFLLHLTKEGDAFPVRSLGPCGFYPCAGARRQSEAEAISNALNASPDAPSQIATYHPKPRSRAPERIWVEGEDYWIAQR
ncbi:MAG: rRNA adenine N-6-methyltransferase family protein [Pseudomonadota bacterium]